MREVVAGDVLPQLPAGAEHTAVHQHGFEREHVVARESVLDAVRTAGVLGDVAADRARGEARGVGRVVEPVLCHRLGEHARHHARLHDAHPVCDIDLEDPIHTVERQRDPAVQGQGAAGESRAAAPGRDGYTELERQAKDRLDILGRSGAHGDLRHRPEVLGLVVGERFERDRIVHDVRGAECVLEARYELGGDGGVGVHGVR